jgi:hypothetical protein
MKKRVLLFFLILSTALLSLDYFEIYKSLNSDTYHEWKYDFTKKERARRIFRLLLVDPIKQVVNTLPSSTLENQDTLEFYITKENFNEFVSVQKQMKYISYLKSGVRHKHEIPAYFINTLKDTSKVKVRTVGMMTDHYSPKEAFGFNTDIGSFKVKFGKHSNPYGRKSRKSLLLRNTRKDGLDNLANALLAQLVDSANIIVESLPVAIIINGKVYSDSHLLEDGFDKYLVEKNRKREGSLFKMGWDGPIRASQDILSNKDQVFLDLDYAADDTNFVNAVAHYFNLGDFDRIPFDFELLDAVMIICLDLFGGHPLVDNNLHWYHNPVTNRIEPTLRECLDSTTANFFDSNGNDQFYQYWLNKNLNKLEEIRGEYYSKIDCEKLFSKLSQSIDLRNFNEIAKKIKRLEANYRVRNIPQKNLSEMVLQGNCLLDSTLRLTKGQALVFEGGLNLKMGPGAKIILEGSSVTTRREEKPIVIEGGSILIVRGNVDLENVSFRRMTALIDTNDYHFLPSAFTTYESSVSLKSCGFESNILGDDYLNLFRSNFILEDCDFNDTRADAFDSDFSKGIVKNCLFSDIGNDALDASGSEISVLNCLFKDVQDKAVSAGEFSIISVTDSRITNSEIGLCSKDGSTLRFDKIDFERNTLDATAYRKKLEYPGHNLFYMGKDAVNLKFLYDSETKTNVAGTMDEMLLKKMYGVAYGKSSR